MAMYMYIHTCIHVCVCVCVCVRVRVGVGVGVGVRVRVCLPMCTLYEYVCMLPLCRISYCMMVRDLNMILRYGSKEVKSKVWYRLSVRGVDAFIVY